MKIVVVGFMGSGKSTVSKLLAERCGAPLIEMDEIIVSISKYGSIAQIFEQEGEEAFRELERKVTKKLALLPQGVISTGGGIIEDLQNITVLKGGGCTVIFLKTSFDVLKHRLLGDTTRPLFKDISKAEKLYQLRSPKYEDTADHIVITDNKTPADILTEIVTVLRIK